MERKQELFDGLVDDVSIDLSSVLPAMEPFGLFGLEAPAAVCQRLGMFCYAGAQQVCGGRFPMRGGGQLVYY